uniref:DUF229 domain containing protein n=1 Tax=Romanomermis culicivorax TaxID=13658 RepID=A0A915L8W2_ROMCU
MAPKILTTTIMKFWITAMRSSRKIVLFRFIFFCLFFLFICKFYFSYVRLLNIFTIDDNDGEDNPSINRSRNCLLASNQLRLHGPEIDGFFRDYPPLKCALRKDEWISIENMSIRLNEESVQIHGGYINCTYIGYKRGKDDHELRTTRKLGDVPSGSPVLDEVFRLRCKALDDETFESTYVLPLPLTTETIQRVETAMSDTKKRMKIINQPPPLNLNVYIIGFDSLSRLTFQRKLKQMFKYLTQDLNGVVMEGYNIVGDGTPQALIPILTGKTEVELPLTRKRFPDAQHVDVYPWVWNEYKDNGKNFDSRIRTLTHGRIALLGYVTLYGEDSPSVGTFTYRLKGFLKQPTDYYMRTFHMVSEKFDGHPNGRWCFGNRSHHEVHFQYVKDFFDVTPRWAPKFAFQFHSVYSHDDLNAVEIADGYMVEHLKYFKENVMNNSVLIVMSDHGHRFSQLRATHQGKLEERLPMFSVVMPAWFKKQFPVHMKNLRTNTKRLTTPFDIRNDLDGFEPEFSVSSSNNVTVEYLEIDFLTKPGGAHYEASVTFDVRANEIHINLDSVSHVNAYGDKPHCVVDKDYFLATWCVCLDKI